jgi:hypothetical protein
MKSMYGLILAVVLGILGALFNWAYLKNRTSEKENVYFVGVKRDVTLNSGDTIKAEQLESVGLPKDSVGNLKDFAVVYETNTTAEGQSVVGQLVSRVVQGGRLLMNDDLRTPRPEFRLEPGEEAMFVPIDTRSIVTSLIVPGDQVVFLVAKNVPGVPTSALRPSVGSRDPNAPAPDPASEENPNLSSSTVDRFGPFKVLSIGNRLGSVEVMKSAKIPIQQDNVMTISVKPNNEISARNLQNRLDATNYRQVGVRLVQQKEK